MNEDKIRKKMLENLPISSGEFFDMPECHIDGLEDAASVITDAIRNNLRIYIIGDYDADGINASTEMYLLCSQAGNRPNIRIPKRFSEGYGLSPKIMEEIVDINAGREALVITVDNGIKAYEAVKIAKDAGFRVVVIDHHLADKDCYSLYSDVDAVVNQSDGMHDTSAYGYTPYCGAGLVLKLAEELNKVFHYSERTINSIRIMAGIATIADVVPLINGNRKIVKNALQLINTGAVVIDGLDILLKITGLDLQSNGLCNEDDFAFKLGPMFNAPGRLIDNGADIVYQMLLSNKTTAYSIFQQINSLNIKRKDMVQHETAIAEEMLSDLSDSNIIILHGKEFHLGICGIVAGKLAEKYQKPAIVLADLEDGSFKGSARNCGNISIIDVINEGKEFLLSYGGHEGAAGLKIKPGCYEKFTSRMQEIMNNIDLDVIANKPEPFYIDVADMQSAYDIISDFAPFGTKNPAPLFTIKQAVLTPKMGQFVTFMGKFQEHVKFYLQTDGVAVGFWQAEKYKKMGMPLSLNLTGTLVPNMYMGQKSIQMCLIDFDISEKKEISTSLKEKIGIINMNI